MFSQKTSSSRRALALNLAVLGVATFGKAAFAQTTVTDTFNGGGTPNNNWLVPGNWSLDVVPNNTAQTSFIVNLSTSTPVVLENDGGSFTASSVGVFDLDMSGSASLDVELPLTVTDAINASGNSINVIGALLTLAPQGTSAANPANISVQSGGIANLGYSTMTINNSGTTLSADGFTSILNLSSLQTLTYGVSNNGNRFQYTISATNTGAVSLSGLKTIVSTGANQILNFDTSGGGTINLNSLQAIDAVNVGQNFYGQVVFDGSFSMPSLTTARLAGFGVTSGQSISAPALTDLDNSQIEVAGGGSITTGPITDIDNDQFFITAGGVFGQGTSPISATSYTVNSSGTTLSADGSGSILNLSSLQTLTYGVVNNGNRFQYTVSATNNGDVNLNGLKTIVSTGANQIFNFDTSNGGTINLNSLQTIDVNNDGYNFYGQLIFDGSFSMPALTTARQVEFGVVSGQSISAPALTDLDNSEIEVSGGGSITTGPITDIDNDQFFITAGGVFGQGTSPISATSYTVNSSGTTLSADGSGSILNLSSLQTLTYGVVNNGNRFQYTVSATNNGDVNLNGLKTIVSTGANQIFNFDTSNGGTINLNSLQTIDVNNDGYNFYGQLIFDGSFSMPSLTTARLAGFGVTSGQSISAPALTDLDNSEIEVSGGGSITTGPISDIDNDQFFITAGGVFGQGTSPISATSYTVNSSGTTLSADGSGSILNLSSLQTLTYGLTNNGNRFQYTASATNNGTVNLSGLKTIVSTSPNQILNFDTSGGGTINLNSLQTIDVNNAGYNFYGQLVFDGSFSMPALTTARQVEFGVVSGQSISAPALTDLDNSEVLVADSGSITTGPISDIDNDQIFITAGGVFGQGTSPISATSYTVNSSGTTLSADGSGSILNLSSLQTLTYGLTNNGNRFQYTVSATNNGTVNLSGLKTIVSTSPNQILNFDTSGGGTINLNSLQTIDVNNAGYNFYGQLVFDGSFSMPALTTARQVEFDVVSGQTISAPALTDLDNSEILVSGSGSIVTGAISDIDNDQILVTSDGVFGQGTSQVTAKSINFSNGGATLSADGASSILNLSSLAALTYGFPGNGSNFQYTVSATDGGGVNLANLATITSTNSSQTLNINADTGGTINLGSLQAINPTGGRTVFSVAGGAAVTTGGTLIAQQLNSQFTAFNVSNGGVLTFRNNLTLGTGDTVNFAAGSTVASQGNFNNTLNSTSAFQAGTATFIMNGQGVQTLEAAGADDGAVNPGNNGNFGFGQLVIGANANPFPTEVDLVDNINNGNRGSGGTTPEALYLFGGAGQSGLVIDDGSLLYIGSLNAYTFESGSWVSLQSLFTGTQTIVPFNTNGSDGFIAKSLITLQDSWINSGSGAWNTASNWSLGTVPADLNDTFITTASAIVVTGPTATDHVRSLTINGPAAGPATVLNVNGSGELFVNTNTQIDSQGQLNQTGGTLSSFQMTNQGAFTQSATTIADIGSINNTGTITTAGTLSVTNAVTNNNKFNQIGGAVTLGQLLGTGTLTITAGKSAILPGPALSTAGGVTVSGTGTLDLSNNSLLINYTGSSPLKSIQTALISGYNNGLWNGPGIDSSAAATTPKFALGYADGKVDSGTPAGANQLLIEYTIDGDANLDGSVAFADLVAVAEDFGKTGQDWAHGNFTYDPNGSVGFGDLVIVAENFGLATPVVSSVGGPTGVSPLWAAVQPAAVVPEPGAIGLAAMAAVGLLGRRTRRRRNMKS